MLVHVIRCDWQIWPRFSTILLHRQGQSGHFDMMTKMTRARQELLPLLGEVPPGTPCHYHYSFIYETVARSDEQCHVLTEAPIDIPLSPYVFDLCLEVLNRINR